MRAARLHAYGQALVLEDVPKPSPGPDQALVKVDGAGFCHSDIHVIDGEIQVLPRMP
jgi:propanol-preferring alcohol dehydrogenase